MSSIIDIGTCGYLTICYDLTFMWGGRYLELNVFIWWLLSTNSAAIFILELWSFTWSINEFGGLLELTFIWGGRYLQQNVFIWLLFILSAAILMLWVLENVLDLICMRVEISLEQVLRIHVQTYASLQTSSAELHLFIRLLLSTNSAAILILVVWLIWVIDFSCRINGFGQQRLVISSWWTISGVITPSAWCGGSLTKGKGIAKNGCMVLSWEYVC